MPIKEGLNKGLARGCGTLKISSAGDGAGVVGRIGAASACLRGLQASADTLRRLAAQQMRARHEQIGQCAGHDQAMSVVLEPAITHLGESEHTLDDPDRMFDPRFREGRLLARTLDLVRFFARSISSTTPRWRQRRLTKSCARGACWGITARWSRYAWSPHTRVSFPCNKSGSTVLSATLAGVAASHTPV